MSSKIGTRIEIEKATDKRPPLPLLQRRLKQMIGHKIYLDSAAPDYLNYKSKIKRKEWGKKEWVKHKRTGYNRAKHNRKNNWSKKERAETKRGYEYIYISFPKERTMFKKLLSKVAVLKLSELVTFTKSQPIIKPMSFNTEIMGIA